ncbi:MAG: YbaB/EbfC family nucleoid-associated protein [Bacteroidetes bacterium]|nr:YbaB/EbfC family nucleoid-associated protein [Bacteroidota bacterium]MBU1717855.1 YbaB/EbfC family nucleoid-associated protein [Bacteroidota bacterium]
MFGKLQEAQKQLEEIKKRLDHVLVDAEAGGNAVKVTVSASKIIRDIEISEDLMAEGDREAIQDLIVVALNRALNEAEKVSATEMQTAARNIMPGFPGLG